MKKIRVGTRSSALALKQADIIEKLLSDRYPEITIEIVTITTTGDKILDKNLASIGGKGLFIKEIEEALLDGRIDIAVHSMKDMPASMPPEFSIPCVLEREDPRDLLISHKYKTIADMPQGAVIGTSSARRAAQTLNKRPDLKIIPFRGNVQTRLRKLAEGVVDATFLAAAGMNRLGLIDSNIMHILPPADMLPAVSQGAIGIEILSNNNVMTELLHPLNHIPTFARISAERSFMRVFEGSCSTPIAALSQFAEKTMNLECLIAKTDGSVIHKTKRSSNIADAENMGEDAALELKKLGGDNFFD